MTARVCILLLLAATRGVWSILEQPSTSLMHLHPTFQRVMAMMNIRRLGIRMSDFGGASRKSTLLYSKIDQMLAERRPATGPTDQQPQMTIRYIDGSGKNRCKGGADLKASQHYPKGFGKALSRVRSRNQQALRRQAKRLLKLASRTQHNVDERTTVNAHWMKHANLGPVLSYLAARTR
ncbi:unnamed protein product [Durusdinium trenchii]|uniref:Uncharacterized protein n=1 Tax=Durusdinium trenchii TaxID=1381693 RepID=A0ABP0PQ79_9DINO